MKILRIGAMLIAGVVVVAIGFWFYTEQFANPRVAQELLDQPDGNRARKVMLLTLPSGRRIPVNYYRKDDLVFAAADGNWWKELDGADFPVTLLVRGETLRGVARAILDDADYTREIFKKLRPNAIEGFGKLVEIRVGASSGDPSSS